MAENLEKQLVNELNVSKISLQINATTINNLLLAYVRYINGMTIREVVFFIKNLTHTQKETTYIYGCSRLST